MPDWCESFIEMYGSDKDLDEIEATNIDFEAIIPTPKEILENAKDNDWWIENWGVKWDREDEPFILKREKFGLKIYMLTPWDIPYKIFEKMTQMWPDVMMRVTHTDEGGFLCGTIYYKHGKIFQNDSWQPSKDEYNDFDKYFVALTSPYVKHTILN